MPGSEQTRRPGDEASLFIVLVLDPETGEIDSYGPYTYGRALSEACRRRDEYEREALDDVIVAVVPLHPGPPLGGG